MSFIKEKQSLATLPDKEEDYMMILQVWPLPIWLGVVPTPEMFPCGPRRSAVRSLIGIGCVLALWMMPAKITADLRTGRWFLFRCRKGIA